MTEPLEPTEDIGYMLKKINDTLEKRANADFKKYDVTLTQVRVLHFIMHQKGRKTTQKELEEFFGISHPTINGILKRLEEKNFITTEISVERRLTKTVRITRAGEKICMHEEENRGKCEQVMAHHLSEKDRKNLISLLSKVYQGLLDGEWIFEKNHKK